MQNTCILFVLIQLAKLLTIDLGIIKFIKKFIERFLEKCEICRHGPELASSDSPPT